MKLKDIFNSRHDTPEINERVIVKPMGTGINYYDSNIHMWLDDEIADLEVDHWFVIPHRKNVCTIVIIVEQNIEYELKKRKLIKERLK